MDKLLPAFIEHRTAPLLAYLTHPSFPPNPAANTVLSRFIMLFALLLTLRLLFSAYACIYPNPHPPRAPSPSPSCAPWSYSGETGPLLWAGLPKLYGCAEDWSACRTGRHQSPVVIYTSSPDWTPLPLGALDVRIDDVPAGGAELWNLNTTLEVPVHNGVPRGELKLRLPGEGGNEGTVYTMLQFHFHTPSEHRIDEEHYPLEMHLVFRSASNTLAVLGILFQLTPSTTPNPNPLLTGTFLNLPLISTPNSHAPTGPLPFTPLLSALRSGQIYTYAGSLTTPPCTEGVRWLVLRTPQPLGVALYNDVKAVMKFNARYTQNVPGGENLLELARRQRSAFGAALRVQG